ncbi:MAG: DUF3794 domain-containing protein [Clostridia bacterium]|nr:DUF3794 domain-containing protein [Clostridia bacterium]
MQDNRIFSIKTKTTEPLTLNNDYTLPDYIVDVRKLLHYTAKAMLHNVYISGRALMFEGEVIYSAFVLCEDNSIKNIIYSDDFEAEIKDIDVDENQIYDCRIDKYTLRLISPRKLNCRADITVSIKLNDSTETDSVYKGIGLPEAEYTTEKRFTTASYVTLYEDVLKKQHGVCNIQLVNSGTDISEIIYTTVNICISERRQVDGKLFLRGEGTAQVLYTDSEGRYCKAKSTFPFSEILENQSTTDAHICTVEVSDIKASFNISNGEKGSIEIDYSYDISDKYYISSSTQIMSDIYSTEYDVEYTVCNAPVLKLNDIFDGRLTVDDYYDLDVEYDDVKILDCFASLHNCTTSFDRENGRILISGDVKFEPVFATDTVNHISVVKQFKYERSVGLPQNELICDHNVALISCNADADKGKLLLTAEIALNAAVLESCEYEFIKEVEIKSTSQRSYSPVIIYYPSAEDTLWEIAKRYKCTCNDIMSANRLENESLKDIKVLLLPRKRSKSVFNAII